MKELEFHLFRLATVICLGALSMEPASAQEPAQVKEGWDVRLGLPLWAPGTTGTIGVRHREVHIDDSFTDLLDTLDFTAALNLEVRKSHWLFFAESLYLKTSTTGEPKGIFSGAQVELDQKLVFSDLALGYAVVKNECFSLEPFVGAQLTYLEPTLTLDRPIVDRTASTSKFWADPIIGLYANYRFSQRVGLYAKGDVGGFDVASRLTWQVEGGLDVLLGRIWYARLAYRYLNIDYEKGDLLANIATHGPQLELGVRF